MKGGAQVRRAGSISLAWTKSHSLVVSLEDFVVEDVDRHDALKGMMVCRSLICGNYILDISHRVDRRCQVASKSGVGTNHIPPQRFGYPLHNHVCKRNFRRCEMFSTPRIPTLKSLKDPRMVIWFDIDNTLYSASTNISHSMGERIHGMFTHN
jgi:hypothetical protein